MKNGLHITCTNIPNGYRASWCDRDKLAMAKLYNRFNIKTTRNDYAEVLLNNSTSPFGDLIEVHIYGKIHLKAIECVVGPKPRNEFENVLCESIGENLENVYAYLELY